MLVLEKGRLGCPAQPECDHLLPSSATRKETKTQYGCNSAYHFHSAHSLLVLVTNHPYKTGCYKIPKHVNISTSASCILLI